MNKRALGVAVVGGTILLTSFVPIHGVSSPASVEASVDNTKAIVSVSKEATSESGYSKPSTDVVQKNDSTAHLSVSDDSGGSVAYRNINGISANAYYLYFYSVDCPACDGFGSKLKQFASLQNKAQLPIYKVDVSELSKGELAELKSIYNTNSIPSVYEFKNGEKRHLELGQIYSTISKGVKSTG